MFAVDVCRLPATGGSTFVVAAGLFMLIAGVIVTRWVRASAGRMSVVVAPLVLLGGFVLAPSVTDPCSPTTTSVALATTVAPTTTAVPVDPNLVLEIDTTVRVPVEIGSVTAADESFVFELGLWGEVDVQVDWGDGSTDNVSAAGPFPHTYTTSGRYTITVSGSLTGFGQDPLTNDLPLSGAHYLKAVRSFGELGITSLSLAFLASVNLIDVPATLPATVTDMSYMFGGAEAFNGDVSGWDTGSVTYMSGMFYGASSFNGDVSGWDTGLVSDMSYMFYGASSFNGDVSGWDTGSVTDMSAMFATATAFNGDVSGWDTGSVTYMSGMFFGASSFNGDVSGWDTGLVTYMSGMFNGAEAFNGDVSGWDTGSVTDMSDMFYGASSFNKSLNNWDTGLVTSMSDMFYGASSFNGDVSGWDTGSVTDMRDMFSEATSFNGDVSDWDTGSVTSMYRMFGGATAFNGDVSGWDTGSVTSMEGMFSGASSFNGDVSGWDTGLVTNMSGMFSGATAFNQSLGAWDISEVIDMSNMLDNSALSVNNYDATLHGWADNEPKQSNVALGAVGLYFSNDGSSAHSELTNCWQWQIIDEGNQSVAPGSLRADSQLVTIAC
jgi:surface protein